MKLQGVYTALVTPFNKNGSVDEKALRELVERQIKDGISGFVPMGTTGESPTLDHTEHMHVIELVVDQTKKRVPVIAGTGSNSTDEAVMMTKQAYALGADATLQVAPYYNKPSQEGFYRHFATIADCAPIPSILYNIPGRCGKNVETQTILRLAQHPNIIGVKEASGSLPQVMDIIAEMPPSFSLLSGDDNLTLPIMALGGVGVISVASNLIPKKMLEMVNAALSGDIAKAKDIHYSLLPIFKIIFIDTNPVPIKYALSLTGAIEESYRLPLCPMEEGAKAKLRDTLKRAGVL